MTEPFSFREIDTKLMALCERIDRYAEVFADIYPYQIIDSQNKRTTLFSVVGDEVFLGGIRSSICHVHIDHMPPLTFIYRDRELLNKQPYVSLFFGDHDKINGTDFYATNGDVGKWQIRSMKPSYETLGGYLSEWLERDLYLSIAPVRRPDHRADFPVDANRRPGSLDL